MVFIFIVCLYAYIYNRSAQYIFNTRRTRISRMSRTCTDKKGIIVSSGCYDSANHLINSARILYYLMAKIR